ncbi:MAG: hypothetical protein Q4G54_09605 [Pelistega sp.]|nr:hypothetical protein [Pelistega sp.]
MDSEPNTQPIRTTIARAASIIGHPLVFLSIAAIVAAMQKGASMQQLKIIVLIVAALGLVSMAYSYLQVRSGRWSHIDASAQSERRSLNVFLAILCLLSATVIWVLTDRPHMSIALGLSGALFLIALLLSKWVKLSLHTAFAIFATALMWPNTLALILGILMTGLLIWSRLSLGRHVIADIIVGLLAGGVAGVLYQLLTV